VSLSHAWDKTYEAVERQLTAMGAELFEVGSLQRADGDQLQFMLLRTWDRRKVIDSVPWLRYQNRHESHIYERPKGESNLTLVDDLKLSSVTRMRQEGTQPAAVVQTSPGNFQAWIKHATRLDKELGTAVARELAKRFGGDLKAADWRHLGRLAGFRNTKGRYRQVVPVPDYDAWRGDLILADQKAPPRHRPRSTQPRRLWPAQASPLAPASAGSDRRGRWTEARRHMLWAA